MKGWAKEVFGKTRAPPEKRIGDTGVEEKGIKWFWDLVW